MGAYSFLRRRISSSQAQQMMLDGRVYSSDELHKMGVVDILVPKGEGVAAVQDLVKRNQRIGHARLAMNRVESVCHPVSFEELMTVTEIWVDTALQLGEKSLRVMERLVRAQLRRNQATPIRPAATANEARRYRTSDEFRCDLNSTGFAAALTCRGATEQFAQR